MVQKMIMDPPYHFQSNPWRWIFGSFWTFCLVSEQCAPVPTALSVVAMKTFAPLKIADDPTRPGVWGPSSKCRQVNFFKGFFFPVAMRRFWHHPCIHSFIHCKVFLYAEANCSRNQKWNKAIFLEVWEYVNWKSAHLINKSNSKCCPVFRLRLSFLMI